MSEQPRRRRRQTQADTIPIIDTQKIIQEESLAQKTKIPVIPGTETISKSSKIYPNVSAQNDTKKRTNIACLGAAGIYVIANTVNACMSSGLAFDVLCVALAGSVLRILPIIAVFLFDSKQKHIPAIVSAVVVVACEVIPYIGSISTSSDFVQVSVGAKILNTLIRLPDIACSIALLVFAVKKRKNYHVWTIIGAIILIVYVTIGMGIFVGLAFGVFPVNILALGLVYFFGMMNVQQPEHHQEHYNGKYALLEQYKKNRRMMN